MFDSISLFLRLIQSNCDFLMNFKALLEMVDLTLCFYSCFSAFISLIIYHISLADCKSVLWMFGLFVEYFLQTKYVWISLDSTGYFFFFYKEKSIINYFWLKKKERLTGGQLLWVVMIMGVSYSTTLKNHVFFFGIERVKIIDLKYII